MMLDENIKEPSQLLLDSYIENKRQIKEYMNKLEEGYKEIEGVRHVRRCLLLHCIVLIQRTFKKHREYMVNKAALKIQKSFKLWAHKKKHSRLLLMKVRMTVAMFKIKRWLKLARKKRIIRLCYPKESSIIDQRLKNLRSRKEIVKCQSVVRRYIAIHAILPRAKMKRELTLKRNAKRERNLIINTNKALLPINYEQVQMKLAVESEIARGRKYLQEQRTSFEASWENYLKLVEQSSAKQSAKHMKDWVSQRDKYGKQYWMNTKTAAQQYVHPGKTWVKSVKEKNYVVALEEFERVMMPVVVRINDYRANYEKINKTLIEKKARIITEIFGKSNLNK
eukprot:TRINITY_DN14755_c0_g1_i1.p1 TRINITY_DN14755_c0_g1~~TRINITY_DN14755_c0_g1_i1.p1  ORF type:complete len:356 (+),score=49.75 TRINITY_DN14755_c0_g1_i1:58-1068(+)